MHGAVFGLATAVRLALLPLPLVAPNDAVEHFAVAVLDEKSADTFGGVVGHEVAVVGGELASGIHGTSVLGRVVGHNAVLECRLGIIIKVYAAAFSRSCVVADATVGENAADAVANAAAHRGCIVDYGAVDEADVGCAAARVGIDAAAEHGGFVVGDDAVRQGGVVVQIGSRAATGLAVADGETVPKGSATVERFFLCQHTPYALSVENGGIVDEIALREVVAWFLVAFETAMDLVVGGDVKRAVGVVGVAVIGSFFHPNLCSTAA